MKYLLIFIISLITLCTFSCDSIQQSNESDYLAQYRDTLIGNFSGQKIDTLLCEPMDSINADYKGSHYKWKIYTKNNTVRPLIINYKTIGIHFVKEGDLDGNGTDEWGYVAEWETSNWMCYHAFTNKRGNGNT